MDFGTPSPVRIVAGAAVATAPSRKPLMLDIERAKGFSILLILCAHIVARDIPRGNEWYFYLKHSVLEVTVLPFFLYISGLVGSRAIDRLTTVGGYLRFVRDRAQRLLLPFFTFGVLVVFGKIIAAQFIFVDNQPSSIMSSVLALVWHTHQSAALSVWYLYTLFALCVVMPLLLRATRGNYAVIFAASILLYFYPAPDYFYLDRVLDGFPAFVAGCYLMHHYDAYTRILDRFGTVFIAISAVTIALWFFDFDRKLHFLFISLAFLPAQHALIRLAPFNTSQVLITLGKYSFVIYLLNTIFIGLAKGVTLRFVSWDGGNFAFVGPILYASGLLGPILTKRYLIRRFPVIDRATT